MDRTKTGTGQADDTRATFDVVNPATGQVIGQAPDASPADLDAAVAAARAAFPGWSSQPVDARRAILTAMGDRIFAHVDEIKALLTAEQGKPLADAEGEVLGAGYWLQSTATIDLPDAVLEDSDDRRIVVRRVPIGVVGAIAPWNYPLLLAMFKVGPALLAGNTVVVKPSPFTPLSTLKLVAVIADLLPPGVLTVVTGGDRLGPWLTEHPGIDKISFTGSTDTGRRVMRSAATTLKRITLELGGNDAAIVLPDADIDRIVPDLFWAAFRNAGQICIATKRLYVHAAIYDRVRDALVAFARTVTVGDGRDPATQIGPISNRAQYERILALIADSHAQHHVFALGGETVPGPGYFISPAIVDNPPEDSRIVREEQFGPILPMLRYDDADAVVARVNAGEHALGTSIWSRDETAAAALARRMASGTVWINEAQHLSPFVAFGGRGQSGIGVEGGIDGLRDHTVAQTIMLRKGGASTVAAA